MGDVKRRKDSSKRMGNEGLVLTEEQMSDIWDNFFPANSLLRLLKSFHEDNPHEYDTLNT